MVRDRRRRYCFLPGESEADRKNASYKRLAIETALFDGELVENNAV